MKKLFLLFLTISASALAANLADTVNAMNYPLCRVMKASQTYAGVLADAQKVTVLTNPRGLVAGLTLGLANATLGTNLGCRKITLHQYVVRLDETRGQEAAIITLIQGDGGPLIEPGTPVFLATEASPDGYVFSVRMIPSRTPEAYSTQGLEESRIKQRQAAKKP